MRATVECKDPHRSTVAAIILQKLNRDIINSSSKRVGYVEINDDTLVVCHDQKPRLVIDDATVVQQVRSGNWDAVITLYDDYTLLISEIAALYDVRYHVMNSYILTLPVKTAQKSGRRNSSFGRKFSEERLKHMSESQIGHPGRHDPVPMEERKRISETLKEGYRTGRITVNRAGISKAWSDGKFKDAKMGRGIQGYFHSTKTGEDHYFRSLLELKYLIMIEEDSSIQTYESEPTSIPMPHASHYTPDFLLNGSVFVELKPYVFDRYTSMKRFCGEMYALNDYCKKHNLGFVVIYDSDIDFESGRYRKYLKDHPDVIERYNIRFKKAI